MKENDMTKEQKGTDKVFIGTDACRQCVRKQDGFWYGAETALECIDNLCDKYDTMDDLIKKQRAILNNNKLGEYMKTFIAVIVGVMAGVCLGWLLWADKTEYTAPTQAHDTAYMTQYYADHGIE
jgi:hypothetical protein